MTALAPTLQAFFSTRLTSQYGASPHTVAAYRDTCGSPRIVEGLPMRLPASVSDSLIS